MNRTKNTNHTLFVWKPNFSINALSVKIQTLRNTLNDVNAYMRLFAKVSQIVSLLWILWHCFHLASNIYFCFAFQKKFQWANDIILWNFHQLKFILWFSSKLNWFSLLKILVLFWVSFGILNADLIKGKRFKMNNNIFSMWKMDSQYTIQVQSLK